MCTCTSCLTVRFSLNLHGHFYFRFYEKLLFLFILKSLSFSVHISRPFAWAHGKKFPHLFLCSIIQVCVAVKLRQKLLQQFIRLCHFMVLCQNLMSMQDYLNHKNTCIHRYKQYTHTALDKSSFQLDLVALCWATKYCWALLYCIFYMKIICSMLSYRNIFLKWFVNELEMKQLVAPILLLLSTFARYSFQNGSCFF